MRTAGTCVGFVTSSGWREPRGSGRRTAPGALFCTDPHRAFLYLYAGQPFGGRAGTWAPSTEDLTQGDTHGD